MLDELAGLLVNYRLVIDTQSVFFVPVHFAVSKLPYKPPSSLDAVKLLKRTAIETVSSELFNTNYQPSECGVSCFQNIPVVCHVKEQPTK